MLGLLICSLGTALCPGPVLSTIAESVDKVYRARAMALHYSMTSFAGIPAPYAGSILMRSSMALPFIASMIVVLLSLLARLFLIETLQKRQKPQLQLFKDIARALAEREVRSYIILTLAFYTAANIIMPFVPVYAKEIAGLSREDIGLLYSYTLAAIGISLMISGYLADRLDYEKVIAISLPVTGFLTILLGFPELLPLQVGFPVWSFTGAMYVPAIRALLAKLSRPEIRGLVLGALTSAINLAGVIGSPVGGVLYEISPQLMFTTSGIIICLIAIPMLYTLCRCGAARM